MAAKLTPKMREMMLDKKSGDKASRSPAEKAMEKKLGEPAGMAKGGRAGKKGK